LTKALGKQDLDATDSRGVSGIVLGKRPEEVGVIRENNRRVNFKWPFESGSANGVTEKSDVPFIREQRPAITSHHREKECTAGPEHSSVFWHRD
jgi:hypothetical protein